MKPIGGYFSLESSQREEFHKEAIRMNTGRNCLEYILRVRKYKKVYIPYYSCDVILEPFQKLGITMELRLLDSSSTVVSQLRFSDDNGHAFYRKNNIGFFLQIKKKDYDLPVYSFSELGKEMLSIVDNVEVNCEYLKDYANSITERDKSLHVMCGNMEKTEIHITS